MWVLHLEAHAGRDRSLSLQPVEDLERLCVSVGIAEIGPYDRVRGRSLGQAELRHLRRIRRRLVGLTGGDRFKLGHLRNFRIWNKIQYPRSPVSPSVIRRTPTGMRELISRMTASASGKFTDPLK